VRNAIPLTFRILNPRNILTVLLSYYVPHECLRPPLCLFRYDAGTGGGGIPTTQFVSHVVLLSTHEYAVNQLHD